MSDRIKNFPVSFFSVVMGLAGFTLVLEKLSASMSWAHGLATIMAYVTALVFILLGFVYVRKLVAYPQVVAMELKHPIKMSFAATISVAVILLSIVFLKSQADLSYALWWLGASLHLVFTLYVLNSWMHQTHFEIEHINPAWFIPVVGNILVPIAGVVHGHIEISWFFFSLGLVFWIILFTIIIYRMIFHHPLPEKLNPTLFILIAPPAAGFIAYTKLMPELDVFARLLFYTALFLTLLLFTQAKRFIGMPFYMSWWAYSFPLAAMTLASYLMYQQIGGVLLMVFYGLSVMLSAIILLLVGKTLLAIKNKKICVEEG